MTYQQVATMVASIGVPYAYYQFPEGTAQAPPFVCFYFEGSDDLYADDKNYQKIRPLTIELYTDNKDFSLEATVEGILASNGLTYARNESWIESERMNMVAYTTDVIITS
jgi:hypothetical protein